METVGDGAGMVEGELGIAIAIGAGSAKNENTGLRHGENLAKTLDFWQNTLAEFGERVHNRFRVFGAGVQNFSKKSPDVTLFENRGLREAGIVSLFFFSPNVDYEPMRFI